MDDSNPVQRWWTRRRRTFAWLLLVLVGCIAVSVLVHQLAVLTVPGRSFEDTALRGASLGASLAPDTVSGVLDVITVTSMMTAVALCAVIALIRVRRELGLAAIALLIVANGLSRILKAYVITRPDLGLAESTPATLNSLPSGHTTAAYSIAVALLIVVPVVLRPVLAALGIVTSSTVAIATMSAGWHRPSDSVASFVLVTACAAAVALVLLAVEKDLDGEADSSASGPGPGARRLLGVIGAGSLVLAGVLLAALASSSALWDSSFAGPAAFVAAGLLLVGTATMGIVLVLGIVARVAPARFPGREPAPQAPASSSARDLIGPSGPDGMGEPGPDSPGPAG